MAMQEDYCVACGGGRGAAAKGFGCAVRQGCGFIGHESGEVSDMGVGSRI